MFRGVRQNTDKSFIACWNEAVGLTNDGMREEACNFIGWIFVYYVKLLLHEYAGQPVSFEEWDKTNHVCVNIRTLFRRQGGVSVKGDVQCGRYMLDKRDLPDECCFFMEKDDINDARIMSIFDDIAYIIHSLKLDLSVRRKVDDGDE